MEQEACAHCGAEYGAEDMAEGTVTCALCGSSEYIGEDANTPDSFFTAQQESKQEGRSSRYFFPPIILLFSYQVPLFGRLPVLQGFTGFLVEGTIIISAQYLCFWTTIKATDGLSEKLDNIWPQLEARPSILELIAVFGASTWLVWVPALIYLTIIRDVFNLVPSGWANLDYCLFLISFILLISGAFKDHMDKLRQASSA